MTPLVEPATVSAPGLTVVPARLVDEGEIVILAIKPSGWFCLLASLPVLGAAGVVLVVGFLLGGRLPEPLNANSIALLACCAAGIRLAIAWFQWVGRLYVLTNRRIIRVSGLIHEEVLYCPLAAIGKVAVLASPAERSLHVGSLTFQSDHPAACRADWAHISHPYEVQQIVAEAISHAR